MTFSWNSALLVAIFCFATFHSNLAGRCPNTKCYLTDDNAINCTSECLPDDVTRITCVLVGPVIRLHPEVILDKDNKPARDIETFEKVTFVPKLLHHLISAISDDKKDVFELELTRLVLKELKPDDFKKVEKQIRKITMPLPYKVKSKTFDKFPDSDHGLEVVFLATDNLKILPGRSINFPTRLDWSFSCPNCVHTKIKCERIVTHECHLDVLDISYIDGSKEVSNIPFQGDMCIEKPEGKKSKCPDPKKKGPHTKSTMKGIFIIVIVIILIIAGIVIGYKKIKPMYADMKEKKAQLIEKKAQLVEKKAQLVAKAKAAKSKLKRNPAAVAEAGEVEDPEMQEVKEKKSEDVAESEKQ